MTKRLFISIPLSPKSVGILENYYQGYSLKGVNWTGPDNFHITVHFLGNVEENFLPEIDQALNKIFSPRKPFTLFYNKILLAPPGREPNMIWAVFNPSQEFSLLCNLAASALGNVVENRDHHAPIPHVTLARFKNSSIAGTIHLKQIKLENLLVNKCQLMESTLTADGPIYRLIKEYNFKG